jgi:hypothetical protein
MIGWPVAQGYDVYGGAMPPFAAMRVAAYRHREPVPSLPDDFPGYLVYVTRETLRGSTTSLSQVSAQIRDHFLMLNQMLVFDRMLRGFAPWAVPAAYGPWPHQPWAILPAPQKPPLLSYWGNRVPALPKPRSTPAQGDPQPDTALLAASCVTALSVSAALLAFTPMMTDAWLGAL